MLRLQLGDTLHSAFDGNENGRNIAGALFPERKPQHYFISAAGVGATLAPVSLLVRWLIRGGGASSRLNAPGHCHVVWETGDGAAGCGR